MIRLGSLFAGIGGFDLGARWAFEKAGISHRVAFQVEQNKYCQSILKKHWPDAQIFDDVRAVGRHNLPDIDILMGGFPCQDISVAGHQKGIIHGKKSSLWFEMLRIISELRPNIVVLENVPAIARVGGPVVVGGLTEIGYDCEWQTVSARQFGAPHLRKRWFCVATNTKGDADNRRIDQGVFKKKGSGQSASTKTLNRYSHDATTNTDRDRKPIGTINAKTCKLPSSSRYQRPDWQRFPTQPAIRNRDDGLPSRLARLRALGNAIVPQCAEYIFDHVIRSINPHYERGSA